MKKAFALFLTALLAACADAPSFTATDITGASIGTAPWSLQDASGKPSNVSAYKGKAVAVFFGFTRCPDVCPTTLVDYNAALKLMGADATKVQVLFITLDPQRDTFPALQQYTAAFNPSFQALRGDDAATLAAASSFKVFFAKNMAADKNPLNYSLDHTAASYVFDPQGNIRLYVRHGQTPATLAKDLQALVK